MALLTVEGVYKNGRIELAEAPAGTPDEARVLVTFLPEDEQPGTADARRAAEEHLLARMRAGIDFGGRFDRQELYD